MVSSLIILYAYIIIILFMIYIYFLAKLSTGACFATLSACGVLPRFKSSYYKTGGLCNILSVRNHTILMPIELNAIYADQC